MKLTDFSELYYGVSNVIYFQSIFLQCLQKSLRRNGNSNDNNDKFSFGFTFAFFVAVVATLSFILCVTVIYLVISFFRESKQSYSRDFYVNF